MSTPSETPVNITNSQDLRHRLAGQASWRYHHDDTMSLPAVGAIELSLILTLVFTVVYRRHRFASRNYEGKGNPKRQPKQVPIVSVLHQVPSFSKKMAKQLLKRYGSSIQRRSQICFKCLSLAVDAGTKTHFWES
jgi:hypothetical protein